MTKIAWTNTTWNPITGCSKLSTGCKNCYAEKMTARLQAMKLDKYKAGFKQVVCHSDELAVNFGKKPKMIFVNSMSDTFHKDVPAAFLVNLLHTIRNNPQHIFQLLTKRINQIPDYRFPDNAWLGATVEHFDYIPRIEALRQITSPSVRFLSFEPLLSDMPPLQLEGINWVIIGAESGPAARECRLEWVRNIKKQCENANIPVFIKQLRINNKVLKNIKEFPDDLQVQEYPQR